MSSVWKFEYSVQERVEALRDILVSYEGGVAPSQIRKEWLYRAQLVLEPGGWYGYWKLPRDTCETHGVRFPCVVYVRVLDLDLREDELLAVVDVVGVQDDSVHLPDAPRVPLEQLWVALVQPPDAAAAIEVRPTAEFIDHYRYFYSLVWMPWDLEEDEHERSGCWFSAHVPARCELWASAFAGAASCSPQSLQALRDDGELVRRNIAKIEEAISSDNEEETDTNSKNVSALVTLHDQLQTLRAKWELLQNPTLQDLLQQKQSRTAHSQSDIVLVWNGGPMKSYAKCLDAADEWLKSRRVDPKKSVGCSPSLATAFDANPKVSTTFLLCDGSHVVPRTFPVADNHTLAAVASRRAVLACSEPCTSLVSVLGPAKLSGLTVDAGRSAVGLTVRPGGRLELDSCAMVGPADSQTLAIMAFGGVEVDCADCTFANFFTGIIAQKGSKVRLRNCTMEGCGVALQVYEGAEVSLTNCTFKNYAEAAIRYETTQASGTKTGGTDILENYDDIRLKECAFVGNEKHVYVGHLDEYALPHLEGNVNGI